MRNKKLFVGVLVVCGLIAVGVAAGGWLIYAFFTGRLFGYEPPETPAELREPRVVTGGELFAGAMFIETARGNIFTEATRGIGSVTDVAVGELDPHPGVDVVVAGRYGALTAGPDGAVRSQLRYKFEVKQDQVGPFSSRSLQMSLGEVQIVDADSDGVCEYLGRGGLDGAALFAHDGARLWSYGDFTEEKGSIDDMSAGDLDGDGQLEFLSAWEGLDLFDRHGNKIWGQPFDFASLYDRGEIVDTDGDGKKEIIHRSGRELTIRDARGRVLKQVVMPFYLTRFSVLALPGTTQPGLVAVEDGSVWLVGFDGQVAAQLPAPLSKLGDGGRKAFGVESAGMDTYESEAVWVKFGADSAAHLAVVANFVGIDRAVLYVYAADGRLVYQEVLGADCYSVAALPEAGGARADLLVGCEGAVWRYTPRR